MASGASGSRQRRLVFGAGLLATGTGEPVVGVVKRSQRTRETMDRDMLRESARLDAEAGLAPVPPLSVVADGVACPQTNPLRDRAVLLLRLGELLLRAERLVARHFDGSFVKCRGRCWFFRLQIGRAHV